MTPDLFLYLFLVCAQYNVEPEWALAVAHVESAGQGQEYRVGRLGKSRYYGPFGIHRDFLKKWPIDEPRENIRRGVMALRGKNKLAVLRRYNPKADKKYLGAVMATYRKNKKNSLNGISTFFGSIGGLFSSSSSLVSNTDRSFHVFGLALRNFMQSFGFFPKPLCGYPESQRKQCQQTIEDSETYFYRIIVPMLILGGFFIGLLAILLGDLLWNRGFERVAITIVGIGLFVAAYGGLLIIWLHRNGRL